MKQLNLTLGLVAVVDDEDYEWLNKWKWSALQAGPNRFYAVRGINNKGKTKTFLMHREILKLKRGDGKEVDHVDRDSLNNQRSNLRIVTRKENCANRRPRSRSALDECSRLESMLPAGTIVNFWRGKWKVKFSITCDSVKKVEELALSRILK